MNASEVLGLPNLDEDLERLEPLLAASVTTGDPFMDEVSTHLIAAGGKRLRPALAVAAATAGERPATEDDLMGGVAVELVHLASLYHDDVMDEALMRRNVESVNGRYGNLVAIVVGDFLLARSAGIAADLGTEVAGLLARTLALLCQGQVTEVRAAFQTARTAEAYFEAIRGKTAALMSTSCRIGALTGGWPREEVDALTEYGLQLGMLFQLRDDVLDVVGSEAELGKPAGQDLAEGVYTLPVIYTLADPDTGPELRTLLGAPLGPPEREKARHIVAGGTGIGRTLHEGLAYAEQARAALAPMRSLALTEGLTALAFSMLDGLPTG